MSKMVIDSNYLRAPELLTYLRERASNRIVITDYVAMELFKRQPLITIPRSMQILAEFPRQVIILKGTRQVCGLSGRKSGLQRRMVCPERTGEFPLWCTRLKRARERSDQNFTTDLLTRGRYADAHMARILQDATAMPRIIQDIASGYGKTEVSMLKRGEPTNQFIDNLISNVIATAAGLYSRRPDAMRPKHLKDVPNLFIFRSALMVHMLVLWWIYMGGIGSAKLETLRNDLVDVNYAAYATYFDGLLSKDQKLQTIFEQGRTLLNVISLRAQN